GRAGDFASEADAARAHDAAVGEQRDVGADVRLVRRRVLLVDHPGGGPAVEVAEVLQHALAGLVAHRAVQRVVEQQALQSVGLGGLGPLARLAVVGRVVHRHGWLEAPRLLLVLAGDDDRAVLGGRLAARHDLGLHGDAAVGLALADLDQAHAAAGHDR